MKAEEILKAAGGMDRGGWEVMRRMVRCMLSSKTRQQTPCRGKCDGCLLQNKR